MGIDGDGEAGAATAATATGGKVTKNGTGEHGKTAGGTASGAGGGEAAKSKPSATTAAGGSAPPSSKPPARLSELYPVNTLWEMTLENGDAVTGRVYCTDEFSRSVVLHRALAHTTLASEVRIVNAAAVRAARRIDEPGGGEGIDVIPLSRPLPKIHKKVLEERERKALKLAEESFRHINQKVRLRKQKQHAYAGLCTVKLRKAFSSNVAHTSP
jgi:hypothetical protein